MSGRVEHIGDATLYLGDCLKIMPTLGDLDVVVTDAPYKVTSGGFGDLEGGFGGWIKDSYDNKGSIVQCDLDWIDWLKILPACLRPDAHVYLFTNDRNLPIAWDAAEKSGFKFHRLLTWDKRAALPNRWYQQTCEFVLFMRQGKAFMINDPSSKALQSIFQRDDSPHPTEKPVPLCRLYIENSTSRAQTVFDPFMGSGTTGVAAVQCGRKFVGIEIDPTFFQIACERIDRAYKQADLFVSPPAKPVQTTMFGDAA